MVKLLLGMGVSFEKHTLNMSYCPRSHKTLCANQVSTDAQTNWSGRLLKQEAIINTAYIYY